MAGSSFRVKPGERVMRPPTPLQCNPALQKLSVVFGPVMWPYRNYQIIFVWLHRETSVTR